MVAAKPRPPKTIQPRHDGGIFGYRSLAVAVGRYRCFIRTIRAPAVDKVSFAPILAAISSLTFRVNWASLRPMRSSNHALNGTRDAINGLCGGENPLCVTMAPWRYSIGEKAPLV
jgi:hypothetical protein